MASKTVVLVHGGFVDGSGWRRLYDILRKDGYEVSVVQNPTLSLEGDVAATKSIIDAQDEPVMLVGHSYGGAVITEAGNNPNVAALVYIAASLPTRASRERRRDVDQRRHVGIVPGLGDHCPTVGVTDKHHWFVLRVDDALGRRHVAFER